jgi:hypothetical protein
VDHLHHANCAPFQSERQKCLFIRPPFVTLRPGYLRSGTPPREVPNEEPPSSPLEMPPDVPELPEPPSPEVPDTPPDTPPDAPPQETPIELPLEEDCGWLVSSY